MLGIKILSSLIIKLVPEKIGTGSKKSLLKVFQKFWPTLKLSKKPINFIRIYTLRTKKMIEWSKIYI